MKTNELTQKEIDDIKNAVDYDPESGKFMWQWDRLTAVAGERAGHIAGLGYIHISIKGKLYIAHRLAFLFMGEEMPEAVDHINGVKIDNRWCNLRPATHAQNSQNKGGRGSASGHKNVYPNGKGGWKIVIKASGEVFTYPNYKTLEIAKIAAEFLREKHHGEFANHG